MLANLTRWFLGGAAGNGKQYISWIHLADLTQMFLQAIEPENYFDGTYNAVSPNPATNAEFMRALRHNFYRPWCPPAPAWAVKLGSRLTQTEPSLALDGCRCAPKRFLEAGFNISIPGPARRVERHLPLTSRHTSASASTSAMCWVRTGVRC
jgi:NAD dependent epimerase/dehydratase family enzyme